MLFAADEETKYWNDGLGEVSDRYSIQTWIYKKYRQVQKTLVDQSILYSNYTVGTGHEFDCLNKGRAQAWEIDMCKVSLRNLMMDDDDSILQFCW